ncbi:protein phosphatase 2C domain-containing protein [bacterium]|nr:protein phosphatase 2C domain-containing protein [bacterium]
MLFAACTDTGLVRTLNQDGFIVLDLRTGARFAGEQVVGCTSGFTVWAVADGMGGAAAGDLASRICLDTFADELGGALATGAPESDQISDLLLDALEAANTAVYRAASEDLARYGMGTTFTAGLLHAGTVYVVHVGDSRLYRLRGDSLDCLTTDHSVVNRLVELGEITRDEARTHPLKHQITRAVGPHLSVPIDLEAHPAQPGDLYLCCSDGLWEMVAEEVLMQTLLTSRDLLTRGPEVVLQDACRQLLLLACEAGGLDNVTVLLTLLGESEAPSGPSPDTAN